VVAWTVIGPNGESVLPGSVNLAGGTATTKATVSLPNGVNVGTYTITFTGSFGSATRSTTASLTVKWRRCQKGHGRRISTPSMSLSFAWRSNPRRCSNFASN